jgi:type II secretory pathway pseudopilin PulG
MKFPISNNTLPIANCQLPISDRHRASLCRRKIGNWKLEIGNESAFTMIEIALCLAIIGFALVAIIGVLPLGMNTQRDNREETVINQDATVLIESIRNAARGADYLTNYVYAITNAWTHYKDDGTPLGSGIDGFTYTTASFNGNANYYYRLTNGANIIGRLSVPEFTDGNGKALADTFGQFYYSNHVTAYVRSLSGLAVEKPPQDNPLMVGDTFTYKLFSVNAPLPVDTNSFANKRGDFTTQQAGNQRELRLTFLWPVLPNGNIGAGRQTFRTTVAGQLLPQFNNNIQSVYFYQSRFTNSP